MPPPSELGVALREAPVSRPAARPWAMLAILLLFYVFGFVDRHVIAMMVDPIRADLAISDTQISLLIGLGFVISFAIGGLPLGWAVDRYPRRWVLWGGVTFWALAEAACGLARGFAQLFGARLMVGFGEAALGPAAHSMITDAFPPRRLSLALSIYTLGLPVGAGLSLLIGGSIVHLILQMDSVVLPLIGAVKPWQFVFIATGLPGIALAFLIFLVPEPVRTGLSAKGVSDSATWAEMFAFLRGRWRLWLSIFLVFGSMLSVFSALSTWSPAYMSRYFHWNPAQYGLALGLIAIFAGGGGLLFSGWMIDRMRARGMKDAHLRYYGIAILISAPLTIFALTSDNVYVFLGVIWIANFALMNCVNIGAAVVQSTTPGRLRGRLSALYLSILVGLPGSIIGTSLPAVIADSVLHDNIRLGNAMALTICACVPVALIGILVGLKPLREAMDAAEAWTKA